MLDERLLWERLKNFKPAPLIEYKNTKHEEGPIEQHIIQEDGNNVDLCKANYLNMLDSMEIKQTAETIIRSYGVGTCGPRAFYGTTDVHLELESKIAEFLNLEEAIVYSYGFVAISSSVAAYCKKNDVVFIDQKANVPIRKGLESARSRVLEFDHNSPESFENLAQTIHEEEKRKNKKLGKFLVIEGLNWTTGKLCPLPQFLDIAEKYKIRVFLEESHTIGVYGKTGRGLVEHFEIAPNRIDMIIGTLENAIGSIGGFCAGTHMTIEHQRLSGSGYIFSASLPTYLVKAVVKSLELIGNKPKQLRKLAIQFDEFLSETGYVVSSDKESPYKIFTLADSTREDVVHQYCKENGVHFIKTAHGLVINLNLGLLEDDERLGRVKTVLKDAVNL